MRVQRIAVPAVLVAGLAMPFSTAKAQYYYPPPCHPFPLFWPVCAAAAIVGTAGAIVTAPFRAVAAVCPAADLAPSADALHDPSNRLYEYYFLMQLFRRFRRKAKLFPETFEPSRLRGISSMRQFDDRITAHYCGFTGADDYYARASAANVIDRIAVPTLIIHAANDPFIRLRPETRQRILANPNIMYIETADGGHCAFLGERDGKPGDDGRWAESEVVEFVTRVSQ